jgi:hypothetical protein
MLPRQWKLIINSVRALTKGKRLGVDQIYWTSEITATAGNVALALVSGYKKGVGDVYQAKFKHGDTNRHLDLNPSLKDSHIIWTLTGSHLSQSPDMTTEEVSESVANELLDFYKAIQQ